MSFSVKKLLLFGFIFVLLIGIPLTVYMLQQRQQTRSHAQASTTLSFSPPSLDKTVGETIPLDININPGTNSVIAIKLVIAYDPTKIATMEAAPSQTFSDGNDATFQRNAAAFPTIMEGPTYTPGKIVVTLNVGFDVTKAIVSPTKVGTLTLKALGATQGTPTKITFTQDTLVSSTAQTDQSAENVLSSASPGLISISPAGQSTTPAPTTNPAASSSASTPNQPPVCSSLNTDRTPSGTAPFSLTFTANGTDQDGTINKASFNFGDSPVTILTQTGGLGSNSVSISSSHTYNNPGVYKASVVLTDNQGATSASDSCTQTITVLAASQGAGGGLGGANTSSQAATTNASNPTSLSPTPVSSIPSTGPGDQILGFGAVVAAISILGTIIFFAL